ncbi:SVOP [Branchiostoma lanceolatum]|uniref:SVOP protein n=1 Tax=Branchiostoma lanceolatum TaxID=7740 RepID=A0A8J9YN69_BRALA|nr:SVOP [Branchiostoma lanceolatum]
MNPLTEGGYAADLEANQAKRRDGFRLPIVKFRRRKEEEENMPGKGEYENLDEVSSTHGEVTIDTRNGLQQLEKDTSEDTFTVEDAVEAIGFGRFQIKLSILTGLSWMADAMEMMILSILSPQLLCEWQLSSWQEAFITTIVFVGMMVSSSMWGNICDRYGRRLGLFFAAVWILYFGILSAFSPTYIWIVLLRGIVGFGIGGVPQSVTLYAEFLPRKQRAQCVVFLEIFWAIGTCIEVVLALVVMPTLGWRWLLIFSAIPCLIFAISCKWLPESARYHVACGESEKAQNTLKKIALENNSPMPLGKLVLPENTEKRGQFKDLFTPQLRLTTVLLWFIWFANAFSYYGIVLMTTELFQAEDSGDANFCSANQKDHALFKCYAGCKYLNRKDYTDLLWTTVAEFPGLLVTMLIIEWLGRKRTMALEFVVFSFFTFLLLTCGGRTWLTIFIFIGRAFISGAFQAAYVYTPEIYPTTTRALGLGTCSGVARLGALLTPFVAQVMLKSSIYLTVSVYGTICLLAAVACLLLPIETKGRSMQETGQTTQPQPR